MNRLRVAKDGEWPGGYCGVCGRRLGDAFGPTTDGQYAIELGPSWYRDDARIWHKARYRGPKRRVGVQSIDTIKCPCGETLHPP